MFALKREGVSFKISSMFHNDYYLIGIILQAFERFQCAP